MDILIIRSKSTPEGTPGKLATEEGFACDTLEPPWKGNAKGRSCIFNDTYEAHPWFSEHLGRMVLRLEDKHDRNDCLLHNATWAGDPDEGYITQIHGCTAVGQGYAKVERPDGAKQFGILHSKDTLAALMEHLGDGTHHVTYQWASGCAPEES